MQFEKITDENIRFVSEHLTNPELFCDSTAVALFLWAEYFNIQYCLHKGILFLKSNLPDDKNATVFFPPYDNLEEGIDILKQYCRQHSIPLVLSPVGEFFLQNEGITQDSNSCIKSIDGWADYLYETADFATLTGRKFNSKRNHVNKFTSSYNHKFVPFCDQNAQDVLQFLNKFQTSDNGLFNYELEASKKLVDNRQLFSLTGGVLYVDNRVAGVTLAEGMGDTLFVHIEKADRSLSGVYETLAHLFAKQNVQSYKYLNREEDLGIEGLRRAKESWHPVKLLNKYSLNIDCIKKSKA